MHYDCATALHIGQREVQQDAVTADFSIGNPFGFAVLSDGMGGHAAGDMASKIVVTEMFSELKLRTGDAMAFERDIAQILRDAVRAANDCISAHVIENPEHRGMGATVVAPVVFETRLYWVSVGDSPLYLFRSNKISRLNEDHSMAPQIDAMVKMGQLDPEVGKNHPDRSSLLSVLIGSSIPKLECKASPKDLEKGDIVVVASDGVMTLENDRISSELEKLQSENAADIAQGLVDAVCNVDLPKQDNISVSVIKVI